MKKDARIYVAGSSGVAGSAIVRLLEREGYHNLLLPKHTELDLSDQWEVDAFFRWQRPEYVFFTAVKMGSIVYRKEHPADIQYENLAMKAHVIQTAHQYRVKKLLFMSSDFHLSGYRQRYVQRGGFPVWKAARKGPALYTGKNCWH